MGSRYKIVLVYAVLTTLWMPGSDLVLTRWIHDPVLLDWIGPVKGMASVAIDLAAALSAVAKRDASKKAPVEVLPSPQISRYFSQAST